MVFKPGKRQIIIFVLIIILYTLSILYGETNKNLSLNESQIKEIAKIEKQYNKFKTVKSKFIQRDSLGNTAVGWFVLEKPSSLRIEYENIPIRFISAGNSLLYQDIEMDQKSFIPLNSTPFFYLLSDGDTFLNNDICITEYKKEKDYTKITFVIKENPEIGSLSLFLTPENSEIIKWNIIDAKGVLTEVFLDNPIFSKKSIKNTYIFNSQRVREIDFSDIE